jgi:molybdate transport system ATP-binding protein
MTGLQFGAALADRRFDVSFGLEPGRTLAVLGPNGAGKSTLLGLVAGLLPPTAGRATLDDRTLFDVDRRVFAEPRHRGVALLAQEALLFPHLSVLENVAFGPRSRGRSAMDARSAAGSWLERVGVAELAGRRPAQLSGGQAQRVAIARALAAEPALLLLDEPLAALDVTVAPAIRTLLQDVLADRSAVIVTHEPLDALLLADDVLVLGDGRVVEAGPTQQVLTRPVTEFGARLAGLNLVQGRATAAGFRAANGVTVPFDDEPEGTLLALVVAPARVVVAREPLTEPGWSWIRATVEDVEQHGELVRVRAGGLAADMSPADVVDGGTVPGMDVFVGLRHADARIHPRRTGR